MLLSIDRNKAHSQQKERGSTAVVATEPSPIEGKSFLTLALRLVRATIFIVLDRASFETIAKYRL